MAATTAYCFICFSSSDRAVALETVQRLEQAGLACWISLRDVHPGQNYQECIIEALDEAKALVFLFSAASAASGETKKELSVAASLNIPVFPVRLAPVTPTGALRYELATRQWIDIFENRDEGFQKLIAALRKGIAPAARAVDAPRSPNPVPQGPLLDPGSPAFEQMRALLARHIGPIAKIVLQKAVTEAQTPDDLCDRLATYVSSPSERASFLREARLRLPGKARLSE